MERDIFQRLSRTLSKSLLTASVVLLVSTQAQALLIPVIEDFDDGMSPGFSATQGSNATWSNTAGARQLVFQNPIAGNASTSSSLVQVTSDIAALGGFIFETDIRVSEYTSGGSSGIDIGVVAFSDAATATRYLMDFNPTKGEVRILGFDGVAPTPVAFSFLTSETYHLEMVGSYLSGTLNVTATFTDPSQAPIVFNVSDTTPLSGSLQEGWGYRARAGSSNSSATILYDNFELRDPSGVGLPEVTIDRTTGNITLVNNSGSDVEDIVGYSILTPSGTLNTTDAVWNSIGESTPFWEDLSLEDGTEITESNLNENPSPISIADGGSINFGNVWFKYFEEDVTFQLQIDDGSPNGLLYNLPVTFTGGTGAYAEGDINFDGLVNEADVTKFAQSFYQPLTGTVPGATYAQGDFNGDLANDHADLLAFRTIYDNANGDGAFSLAMSTSIPEPTSILTIGLLLGAAGCWRRFKITASHCTLSLSALLALVIAEKSQATVVFQENFNALAVGETISTTNSGFTTSATQLVPNNLAVIQDDNSNFFSPSAGNRYLHFADGNTTANGDSNPRIIAPADLTGAKGFEFSFDFYELSDAGGEDVRIGLGDSAYGTASRSIDFELRGTSFKNRGSEQVIPYSNNTKYTAKAIGNYGIYPIVYNGGSDFVLPGQYDVWLNSAKVIDNQAMANGGPKTTHLGMGGGSGDGLGSVFVDNIKVEDSVSSFSYQGEALLTLEVNTSTGQVQIKNPYSQFPLDLDFYKVTGPTGSLSVAGWNGLDDQDGADPGDEGWIQVPGSNSLIAEFTLDNSQASVVSGAPINLGNAYNSGSGAASSLVFQYSLNGSAIYTGLVSVISSAALDGDFNNDGMVNLADYTVWRDNLGGASDSVINDAGDGVAGVTSADYNVWKTNFGAPSGSVSALSTNVPEPSSLWILGAAVGALAWRRSRNPMVDLV